MLKFRDVLNLFKPTKKYITPDGLYNKFFWKCTEQPHILVAGQSGSGKSVFENGLLYTLLYRKPTDVVGGAQLILIDPKRVELVQYKNLPHTLRYASEPGDMIEALNFAMDMTELRYKAMQKKGLRKYTGSDIYVFIDEFADLMTTNKKQVQPLIQRLAQIGRAARVHIVLLTQCPLAKVIPTEIKVNFDTRIGLRTASAQDSRNIIGRTGCERLPEHGKCICKCPISSFQDGLDIFRIDVTYYDEATLNERIQWWLKQK